jgi:PBSX family phage terminase large subunit
MASDPVAWLLENVSKSQLLSIVDSSAKKISLWSGSVSAGKTVASLIAFLFAVRAAPRTGLIIMVGKTLDTIYANCITLMQSPEIFGQRLADQVIYTKGATSAVILGREVLLIGANDAKAVGNIQGKTVVLAYVDEATLLAEPFWDMLITRLRVIGARLIGTMNPAASNHWMRMKWILQAIKQNLIHFHFTMADNPKLPPGYVEDMERAYSGIFYDRFIRGEWTNAEGAVYSQWNAETMSIPWALMPPMYRILGVGMDFGTQHATSCVMLGLGYDRKLYLVDELRLDVNDSAVTLAPSQQAKAIREWLALPHLPENAGLKPEHLIADPAALAWRRELQESGIHTTGAENAVMYGIGLVSSLLARGLLIVSDRCTGVLAEFPGYTWDAKAALLGEDKPVKALDDSMDALRYVIATTESLWRDELLSTTHAF